MLAGFFDVQNCAFFQEWKKRELDETDEVNKRLNYMNGFHFSPYLFIFSSPVPSFSPVSFCICCRYLSTGLPKTISTFRSSHLQYSTSSRGGQFDFFSVSTCSLHRRKDSFRSFEKVVCVQLSLCST